MGWLNNKSKSAFGTWPVAKIISKEDQPDELPMGWYAYQDDYVWYGLKPNPQNTSLVRSYPFRDLEALQEWLEVPLPSDILQSTPSSSLESLVSESSGTQKNSESDFTMDDLDELPEVSIPEASSGESSSSKKENRIRSKQMIFRLSEEEYLRFRRRLAVTGLSQTEYMRRCCLEGRIVIEQDRADTVLLLDMLTSIERELGRQGGMLKMIIKPNLGMRELAPDEWQKLQDAIRYFERTKKRLDELQEKI